MPVLEPTLPTQPIGATKTTENEIGKLPTEPKTEDVGPVKHCFSFHASFYVRTRGPETVLSVIQTIRDIGETMMWYHYMPADYEAKWIFGDLLCRMPSGVELPDPLVDPDMSFTATVTISKADLQKALTDGKTELKWERVKVNEIPDYTVKLQITP